jgi:hypothetical protein
MKAMWLTAAGVCAAGVGFAQAVDSAALKAVHSHQPDAVMRPCLLGSDTCLDVSKIPATACRVTAHHAKSSDACAVDGMKLIGKLTV